jgi:hypothetical protein
MKEHENIPEETIKAFYFLTYFWPSDEVTEEFRQMFDDFYLEDESADRPF